MGIFDPSEFITEYSLKETIEDGMLIEIFKSRWRQLSGGKPIVATMNVYEEISRSGLQEIWNRFMFWKKYIMPKLPEEGRLFSTEINGMTVWVIDDRVCFTLMYPEDY